MPTANEQIADAVTTHSVNLLRVEASLRQQVLKDLKALESDLIKAIGELPADATQFKRDRLNALLDQTGTTINATYDLIAAAQGKSLGKIAGLEQAKTNQILNNTFQVEVATVAQTAKQLETMTSKQLLDGQFQNEWWDKQSADTRGRFARAMREGQARGEGIDALVRRVVGTKAANFNDGIMQVSRRNAEALVRTSIQSAANEARIRSFLANQDIIKGVQWRSTLDDRTTEICVSLDGLQWSLPDFEPVGHDIEFPGPTAHWNCRSTQTAVTRSWSELAGARAVKPPGKPPQSIETLLRAKLEKSGMKETQIAAALDEKRLAFDGEAADPVQFDDFLKSKPTEFQNNLLGPQRAQLWREGKISLRNLIDQQSRPLTINELHGLISKNEAVSTKTYQEGEGGLSLVERKLLEESMVQGIQQKSELTHFVNMDTGERITINGRSPSAADLTIVAGYPRVEVLRNSLSATQLFSPQEMNLFGSLPNFVQAKLVTPAGRVLTIAEKKSRTFDAAAAAKANQAAADLAAQKTERDAFVGGVRSEGSLRLSVSPAGAVTPSTQVFNQTFGALSLPRPLTAPIEEAPKNVRSTFEVVDSVENKTTENLAKALNTNALLEKPKSDPFMQTLAATNGGETVGLDHSVKTVDSIIGKITDDVAEKYGYTVPLAAQRVADSVRYTITFEPKEYAAGAKAVFDQLEARDSGYEIIRWKNKWDYKAYHGINVTLRDKSNHLFLELQIHTPESFDTKENKTHDIYKASKAAKLRGDYKLADKLYQQGVSIWAKVPVPSGARDVALADPPAKITTANIEKYRGNIDSTELAALKTRFTDAFKPSSDAQLVDLSKLISVKDETQDRAFLAGLKDDPRENAALGMTSAINGKGEKRAPLDVQLNEDGTYTILDGNASAQAAMLAGWERVPVIVHDESGAILRPLAKEKFVAPDDARNFPAAISGPASTLVKISSLGGTTGAELWQDNATGLRYVLKRGANAAHIESEQWADELYRRLGVPVPAGRIYQTPQGPVKLTRYIEDGRLLKDWIATATPEARAELTREIQKHFSVDALLSNIDVLGTNMDNIIVDQAGKAWRIDNGGALAFRAQGAPKANWNQGALELWSMRSEKWLPKGITALPANLQFFSPLTIEHVARQILSLPELNLTGVPKELADIVAKRLANAKIIARAALEAVRDQFKLGYVEELSRGRMILRGEAVHEALPQLLEGTAPAPRLGQFTLRDEKGRLFDSLRTPPAGEGYSSIPERVAVIMEENGGSPRVVADWMQAHAGSTWEDAALGYKYFLQQQLAIPRSQIFTNKSTASSMSEAYSDLVRTAGGEAEAEFSLTLWHALVQEVLDKTRLPNVDQARRLVRVLRTEDDAPIFAKHGGDVVKRGLNESGSLIGAVSLRNPTLTAQAVPFSRITGFYGLGRPTRSQINRGSFAWDVENEVSFVAAGQDFIDLGDYELATAKNYVAQQGGEDATKWGLSLEHAVDVLLQAGLITP